MNSSQEEREGLVIRRLAARVHQQQAERLARLDRLADGLRRRAASLAQEVARRAARVGMAGLATLDGMLRQALQALGDALEQELTAQGAASWEAAARMLATELPIDWWLAVMATWRWTVREHRAHPGDLCEGTSAGQVQARLDDVTGLTPEEVRDLAQRMLLPPPTREQVAQWLATPPPGGKTWEERLRRWTDQVRGAMLTQLTQGLAAGEDVAQLERRLRPLADGLAYKSQRIARTEGCRVAERAANAAYEQMGGLLDGKQVVAVMDEWTRPHHAARNGMIYRRGKDGLFRNDQGDLAPDLPDAPNCRCTFLPVLRMPTQLAQTPELAAAFRTAAGKLVPDPVSYRDWWAQQQGQEGLRKRQRVVGVARYQAVAQHLAQIAPDKATVDFEDFIGPDGQLLPVAQLTRETYEQWAQRRRQVDLLLSRRAALYQEVATQAFVAPRTRLPASIQAALSDRLADQWRAKIARQIAGLRVDRAEQKRRQAWQKTLHVPRETRDELLRRRALAEEQLRTLAALERELSESPLPLPDKLALKQQIKRQRQQQAQALEQAVQQAISVPARFRSRPPVQLAKDVAQAPGLRDGLAWLGRVISKAAMQRVTQSVQARAAREGDSYLDRPFYLDGVMVFPQTRQSAFDLVHEFMHHFERFAEDFRERMRIYYERATAQAHPRWLGPPYAAHETYKPRTDGKQWLHPYQGFVGAREMITMKVQLLCEDPLALLDEDPQLFELLLEHLHVGGGGNP